MAKTFTTGEVLTASDVNVNLATFMPMIPTSVAGDGVAYDTTTGLVTLTEATSASLNGVFTSTYSRYFIHYDFPTTSANVTINFRLRVTGSDANTAYDRQTLTALGSSATPSALNIQNASAFVLTTTTATRLHTGVLEVTRPATATPTLMRSESFATLNPATAASTTAYTTSGGLHRTATAYDGFTFNVSGGNASGTIKVLQVY